MRISTILGPSLLVLGLALTGCGGNDGDKESTGSSSSTTKDDDSGDDGGDKGDFDTCGLITTADLEEQFGSPFGPGEATHQEQTGGDQCVWTNTDAPPVKTFSITVMREGELEGAIEASGLSLKELHEQTKEAFKPDEELDLGDDAFRAKTELYVLDGDTQYAFSTFLGTSDTAIAGLKALAAQVVG